MRNRSSQRGFSLVELMIVVALLASLAAIVFPTAFSSIRRTQMDQVFDALDDALLEAIAEANRRSVPVSLQLERTSADVAWNIWVRPVERSAEESGDSFPGESESSGQIVGGFPLELELGSSDLDGQSQAEDESFTSQSLASEGVRADSVVLARVYPSGWVVGETVLRLDEVGGDRSWSVELDPIGIRFDARAIDPELGEFGAPVDGLPADEEPFFEDDWFEQGSGPGEFEDLE